MIPKDFEGSNIIYTAPGCGNLPTHATDPSGSTGRIITSCWHVTDEDLERIKETRSVFLQCHGQQPPVNVTSENPTMADQIEAPHQQ